MKRCTRCRALKPLGSFFARRGASDGRMSSCKECKTEAIYAWRGRNRQRWNGYVADRYRAIEREFRRDFAALIKPELAAEVAERKAKRAKAHEKDPRVVAYRLSYKASRRSKVGAGRVSASEWRSILSRHGYCCLYCGAAVRLTQDHVVPLSADGEHSAKNIVPACHPCNSSKSNREVNDWLAWKYLRGAA